MFTFCCLVDVGIQHDLDTRPVKYCLQGPFLGCRTVKFASVSLTVIVCAAQTTTEEVYDMIPSSCLCLGRA